MAFTKLTQQEWLLIKSFLPQALFEPRVGRPPADFHKVFNTIFYVLDSGCKWENIPKNKSFVPKSVAHRYAQRWQKDGTMDTLRTNMLTLSKLHKKMWPRAVEHRWEL